MTDAPQPTTPATAAAPANLPPAKVARVVLTFFLATFLASRIMVLLIMTRRAPDFFLHVGQTHVHHLNYGIFLLSLVAGASVFDPRCANTPWARALYGIGLALTFDEFGMWLHLGGSYWQRASYDAIITISTVLLLIAAAPRLKRWRPRHTIVTLAIIAALSLLTFLMADAFRSAGTRWSQKLQLIEQYGPP